MENCNDYLSHYPEGNFAGLPTPDISVRVKPHFKLIRNFDPMFPKWIVFSEVIGEYGVKVYTRIGYTQ